MKGSLLWGWTVLACISSLEIRRYSLEYCNMEVFNATCQEDHVIMVESARYGRMNIGRCMKAGYGHQGCSADVLSFLDSKCSGRRSCLFQVPDVALYEMKPCPSDFTSYLEASHFCVPVLPSDSSSCQKNGHRKVKGVQFGFITSQSSLATSRKHYHGNSERCPWVVEVLRGQRINVSLHSIFLYKYSKVHVQPKSPADFGPSGVGEEACFEVGTVVDGNGSRHVTSVCSGNERLVHVTLSASHVINIEFSNLDSLSDIGIFIFEFRATGCPYIAPSPHSWHEKSGDTLVARCNNSIQSWHLICRGTEWIGEAGNCTNRHSSEKFRSWSLEQIFSAEESFPFGVLLAVSIGVAMGIVIGASLLCLITFYLKRQRNDSVPLDGYNQPKESGSSPVQMARIRDCQFFPNHWSFHHDTRNNMVSPHDSNSLTKQAYNSPNLLGETLVNFADDVDLFADERRPSNRPFAHPLKRPHHDRTQTSPLGQPSYPKDFPVEALGSES